MGDGERVRVRVLTVTRREKLEDKPCPACGEVFSGLTRQRYCGVGCRRAAEFQRNKSQRAAARRERRRRQREQARAAGESRP